MSPWEKLLEQPDCGGHFVQLYEAGETGLARNAGHFIWQGLRRGDGVLIVATPEHQRLFFGHLEQLGANLPTLLESKQLVVEDAEAMLAQFMIGGQPEWRRFENTVCSALRQVRSSEAPRVYGEMVGLLWKARQYAAAIRLEQLWNRLLEQCSFSLYCAYAIDVFAETAEVANIDSVLCAHTHIVPAQIDGALEAALSLAMNDVLGPQADLIRNSIRGAQRSSRAVMPTAEATIIWLKKNLPECADEIVRQAREHYFMEA